MNQGPQRFRAHSGSLAVLPDAERASSAIGKDPRMMRHAVQYHLPASPATPSLAANRPPSLQIGLALAVGCSLVWPSLAQAQSINQAQNPVPTPLARDSQGFGGSSTAVPARGVHDGLSVPGFDNVAFITAPGALRNARSQDADPLQSSNFAPITIAPLPVLPPAKAVQASATPLGLSAVPALDPVPGFLQKKRLRKAVKRLFASWTHKDQAGQANTPGGALQSAAARSISNPIVPTRLSATTPTSITNIPRERHVSIASGTVTTTNAPGPQAALAAKSLAPQLNAGREMTLGSTPLPVPPPLTQTEAIPVQPRTLAYVEQIRDVLRAQARNPVAASAQPPSPVPTTEPTSATGLNPIGANPAGADGNLADARSLEQTIANENSLVALFSRGSVGARSAGVAPK